MAPNPLFDLVVGSEIPLETIAVATGKPLAYVCGWFDGFHRICEAQEMLPEYPSQAERDEYGDGHYAGQLAWWEITKTAAA